MASRTSNREFARRLIRRIRWRTSAKRSPRSSSCNAPNSAGWESTRQINRLGGSLSEQNATVRQVLNHTSAGTPGESFRFDAERYAQLTPVVERCLPQPYRKSVAANILERLAMKDSVPGRDLIDPTVLTEKIFADEVLERYQHVLERMAIPYKVDKRARATRNELPAEGINAATGLVTTVRDYARFDAALDQHLLLKEETIAVAWSNVTTRSEPFCPWGSAGSSRPTAANPSCGTSA